MLKKWIIQVEYDGGGFNFRNPFIIVDYFTQSAGDVYDAIGYFKERYEYLTDVVFILYVKDKPVAILND